MRHLILLAIFATLSGMSQPQVPIGVYPSPRASAAETMILEHGLRERANVTFDYSDDIERGVDIRVLPQDKTLLHTSGSKEVVVDVMEKVIKGEPVDVAKLAQSTPKSVWRIQDAVVFGVSATDRKLLQALGVVFNKSESAGDARPSSDHPITKGLRSWPLRQTAPSVSPTGNTIELDEDGLIWAIDTGKHRVVATTITPDLQMLADARFLDFLARATLWIAGELQDNGWPKPGYGGNGAPKILDAMREALAFVPKAEEPEPAVDETAAASVGAAPINWQITFDAREARYLTFEATSAHAGGHFASLAELVVLGADGAELPRKDWRIVSSSSEQAPKQFAKNILDGDIATIWHSRYINGVAEFPHTVRVDMRSSQTVTGVICKPREGSKVGLIKGYRVYASEDAGRGTLLSKGDFAN